MSEFKNAFAAAGELESLICDNMRGIDLASHIHCEEGDHEQLGWTLDRLQADARRLRDVFYAWAKLKKEERAAMAQQDCGQ